MSVATNFRVDYRPGSSFADPGLPSGIWWGDGTRVGDASGGFQRVGLLFQLANDPLSSRLFTVESVMIRINADTDLPAALATVNMGNLVQGRPMTVRLWVHNLVGDGDANSGIESGLPRRPLWLGAAVEVGQQGELRATVANQGALVSLDFWASGFMWEPGALNSPGGVRRPLENIFG